jgi:hypothetical protein
MALPQEEPEGIDQIMSRLSSIFDDTDADGAFDASETVDSAYSYLGANTIVKEDYEQADVKLDYDSSVNNSLTSFDRFGRVVDQVWQNYSCTSTDIRYETEVVRKKPIFSSVE